MERKNLSLVKYLAVLIIFFAGAPTYAKGIAVDSSMSWDEVMNGLDPNCPEEIRDRQEIVSVYYSSFDGRIHKGQVIVDRRLKDDIIRVFEVALKHNFPIQSVIPVSDQRFNWSDEASMNVNNTSAFNYREITGGGKLSSHSTGVAIDINPVQNPYMKGETILPISATYDVLAPGTLTEESPIVKIFLELGWTWGGNWESLKDYQHFEKAVD